MMIYKGIVKRGLIELEGEVTLPEGTRVSVIPEVPHAIDPQTSAITLKEWLQEERPVRAQFREATDSAEILRRLRQQRANP